jgi:hypothetical protein
MNWSQTSVRASGNVPEMIEAEAEKSRSGIRAPLRVVDSRPQSLTLSPPSEDAHLGLFRSESTSALHAMASVSTRALETPLVDEERPRRERQAGNRTHPAPHASKRQPCARLVFVPQLRRHAVERDGAVYA